MIFCTTTDPDLSFRIHSTATRLDNLIAGLVLGVCGDGGIRRRAGGGGGGYRDSEEGGGGLARPKLELNIKVYILF
jgi:hypothetical protein